jgi:hypothetical protein
MTKLSFGLSDDKQSLITTITLKDFSLTPAPGTLGAYYRTIWTSATKRADGTFDVKNYATEVAVDPAGATYQYGQYDTAANSFISSVTATGTYTTGPGGTLKVNVPLSALGNPTIPVTDANALPAVIEPLQ